ncbi:MAG: VWA domain-containing protein [Pirellulaceae bacterium]|nr:VWA domain-containing protein [Pirellulaceae bacterium]
MTERKPDDKSLDERLRDVTVPPSLMLRLRSVAQWDDQQLDWQLRDVEILPGLRHRLRQIVVDEQVDERLRNVPLRSVAVARARIIPWRRVRSRIGRFALAASLLVAVSLGYGSWLGGVVWLMRPVERPVASLMVMDNGPFELVSPAESVVAIVPGPAWDGVQDSEPAGGWPFDQFPLMATIDRLPAGPAGELFAELGSKWDPSVHWMRLRWPVFGYSHPEVETLPDLEMVGLPATGGIPVSLMREFDREFLFSRGTPPPVVTPVNSSARSLSVPLSSETSSWDLLRQQLQRDRLPPPDQLRAEHFLAALDYRLPPPEPGKLALRTAAGPSVFNPAAAGLLQISVKAGEPRRWPRPSAHLTIALDLSASMDWDQRFAAAREGIIRALSSLRPDDRVSLIVFREEPYLLVGEARTGELGAVFEALDNLRPGGSANLGEVLPQAIAAALEDDADSALERRLVLITDSPAVFVPEAAAVVERILRAPNATRLGFDVLDLGDRPEPDAQIAQLVQAAGGKIHRVRSASEIRWALLENLRGDAAPVATAPELTVDFNPRAVAAYRLIGHQVQSWGGFEQTVNSAELRPGEEITTLFEVWLHPNDEDDIATARLRWSHPRDTNRTDSDSIRISRLQFSTTFEGASVSLQEAMLIAEAVEVLGQSFNFEVQGTGGYRYAPKPRDFRHVLQAVQRANPQLRQRADFQRMMAFMQSANRISTERPVAVAKSGTRGIIAGRWRESKE